MAASGTKRPAEIVLGAETRKLRRDLAAAKGEIRGFGKGAAASIRSTIGTAFAGAFSLASLGGAVSVVKDVLANEKALTRLGIQADVSDERVRQLSTSIGYISNNTGQLTSELIAGATQIVTLTGDFDLAARSASALGIAATATGAEMSELAGVAASLGQNLGIKRISESLDALTAQGKKGKVEIKELARLLPTASAQFAMFGEKGMQSVTTLGAGLQVVATATGTASEAATAFNALGKSYIANAKRIKNLSGVDVFAKDKSGKMVAKDFAAITDALRKSKIGDNATKLIKAFGTEEAFKAFNALSTKWGDFQGLITAGLQGGGTIAADFKRYMESPAGRIERAWTRASNALQAAVTPERVEQIAAATEGFARALGFVVDHSVHLVALIGAAKLGQFALATQRWASAMGGVASSTAQVSGAIGRGSAGLSSMASGTGRLVGGLSQALAHAGGIASAFTASYAATGMLLDALGLFEDKTTTITTADDTTGAASNAANHLRAINEERDPLLARKRNLESMISLPGERFGDADRRKQLDADNLRLQDLEPDFQRAKSEFVAATIVERDKARGTDAVDNVLAELKNKELLERTGAVGVVDDVDTEVLSKFGPEAAGLQGADLDGVIAAIDRMIAEQQKTRELQEKVANRPNFDGPAPLMISAPRTGTSPR